MPTAYMSVAVVLLALDPSSSSGAMKKGVPVFIEEDDTMCGERRTKALMSKNIGNFCHLSLALPCALAFFFFCDKPKSATFALNPLVTSIFSHSIATEDEGGDDVEEEATVRSTSHDGSQTSLRPTYILAFQVSVNNRGSSRVKESNAGANVTQDREQ